jgi:hypothetical protein
MDLRWLMTSLISASAIGSSERLSIRTMEPWIYVANGGYCVVPTSLRALFMQSVRPVT